MKWPALVVAIVSSGIVLAQTEPPSFDAASIKLNRSGASGVGATALFFEPNERFKAVTSRCGDSAPDAPAASCGAVQAGCASRDSVKRPFTLWCWD